MTNRATFALRFLYPINIVTLAVASHAVPFGKVENGSLVIKIYCKTLMLSVDNLLYFNGNVHPQQQQQSSLCCYCPNSSSSLYKEDVGVKGVRHKPRQVEGISGYTNARKFRTLEGVGAFGARLTHGQEVLVAKGRVTSVIRSLKGAIAFIVNVILAIATCCKGSRAALVGLSRGGTISQHNIDISVINHVNSSIFIAVSDEFSSNAHSPSWR